MSVQQNPYAAGSTSPPDQPIAGERASATRRFWTFVIDYFATRVVLLLLGVVYAFVYGSDALEEFGFLQELAVSALVYVAYYISLESLFGKTLGKALLGTRVVTLQGARPSMAAIAGRTLARLIPLEPLSITLSDGWWHDSLSGTKVIKTRGAS